MAACGLRSLFFRAESRNKRVVRYPRIVASCEDSPSAGARSGTGRSAFEMGRICKPSGGFVLTDSHDDIQRFGCQPGRHLFRREIKQFHAGVGVCLGEDSHRRRQNPGAQRGRIGDAQTQSAARVRSGTWSACASSLRPSRSRTSLAGLSRIECTRCSSRHCPISSSNALTCRLNAGCVRKIFCAARLMLPASATATK